MTTVTAHDELNIPDFFTELDDDIIAHYGNGPDQKFPGIAEAVTEFNAVIVDFKSREDMS